MRRKNSLPELLAPAGDMQCLYAAVKAGADAVYVGGKAFGARAYAKNFDKEELFGAVIYSVGLFVMFCISSLYHAFPYGSFVKRLFRRFDYSSIYLLIGATFAPILLSYVGGVFGLVFFIVQWVVIATGITFIGVFGPTRLKWLHTPLYIVLGWCGIIFLPKMLRYDPWFAFYILSGGVVYSLGIALKQAHMYLVGTGKYRIPDRNGIQVILDQK